MPTPSRDTLDLELRLEKGWSGQFTIEAHHSLGGGSTGFLPPPPDGLLEADNHRDRGTLLFDWVVPPVQQIYDEALEQAQSLDWTLRVWVRLPQELEFLHVYPWEDLWDPHRGYIAERAAFSRLVKSPGIGYRPPSPLGLRRLVVTTATEVRNRLDVSNIDRLFSAAFDDPEATVQPLLTSVLFPQPTLAALQNELSTQSYHVLHLICPWGEEGVQLENELGELRAVADSDLVAAITPPQRLAPQLVILAAVDMGLNSGRPQHPLALQLLASGVQTVVAFHRPIPSPFAGAFADQFFAVLEETGAVDQAVLAGRLAIRNRAGSEDIRLAPALYARSGYSSTPDAQLFTPLPADLIKTLRSIGPQRKSDR